MKMEKIKMTENERKILEEKFSIYKDEQGYELEQWTNGGVDMIIHIDKNSQETVTEQFKNYVDNFDIDSEIDLYREAENYRNAFSIRESVKDFEDWESFINDVLTELEKQKI